MIVNKEKADLVIGGDIIALETKVLEIKGGQRLVPFGKSFIKKPNEAYIAIKVKIKNKKGIETVMKIEANSSDWYKLQKEEKFLIPQNILEKYKNTPLQKTIVVVLRKIIHEILKNSNLLNIGQ